MKKFLKPTSMIFAITNLKFHNDHTLSANLLLVNCIQTQKSI